MIDLFGNEVQVAHEKPKTFEQEYKEYINSAAWKRIRDAKIKEVGSVCEKCGLSKWSVKLEVHHLTYKNFKKEKMEDLKVLCEKCHDEADEKRVEVVKESRENKSIIKGFENWMDKGNTKHWRIYGDQYLEVKWRMFLNYLQNVSGRKYKIPYWRSPQWHQ